MVACAPRRRWLPLALAVGLAAGRAQAHGPRDLPSEDKNVLDANGRPLPPPQWFSLHYQFTAATQYHPAFDAKYSGQNSLDPQPRARRPSSRRCTGTSASGAAASCSSTRR